MKKFALKREDLTLDEDEAFHVLGKVEYTIEFEGKPIWSTTYFRHHEDILDAPDIESLVVALNKALVQE